MKEYVEKKNGSYYVRGTRVSLDSVVYEFRRGAPPESILRAFPLIGSLERVCGAITFYLAHQEEMAAYLDRQQKRWTETASTQNLPADLEDRLSSARNEISEQQR
ncbi:MAG: hypothetical protein GY953_04170 [bacterium]|nr:hypothetical protein [bacterium]